MICPFKIRFVDNDCDGDCAWYDEEAEGCCIKQLSNLLQDWHAHREKGCEEALK